MANVGVLGAGSWGTALSVLLSDNGHQVTVWSIDKDEVKMLDEKREHLQKLPGVKLPQDMVITNEMEKAIRGKDFLVLAVPSIFTRTTARNMRPYVADGQIIVDVAKGIEESTLKTLSRQIEEEIPQADVAVLSGPSHAEEVGRKLPTTCVIGAKTRKTAEYLQSMFISKVFRVYTSPDILGIELGGSLKNVIALAAGIADGLGYGDNTKAALITRGIAEIARLGVKMGGKIETFTGLTGIGDLIVTCASVHSRNRKAGYLMGQGKTMQEAMDEVSMVVEGVYSAKAAASLAEKYSVSMPIVMEVNKVLFEGKAPAEAVDDLMLRESRSENTGPLWDNPDNLLFTAPVATHLTQPTVYRAFKMAVAFIGRPDARFHDLRHSYAVAALRSGDDVKTVQSNLGHATAAFTLDVYGHVTDKMKQEGAARMEKFIQSVSKG